MGCVEDAIDSVALETSKGESIATFHAK